MRTVAEIFKRSNMHPEDIDHFIFHQVNYRLLQRIVSDLDLPWRKVVVHVDKYANLDVATLPVAFHEAKMDGRVREGDLVLFAAIGAGWQYGAMIMKMLSPGSARPGITASTREVGVPVPALTG